MYRVTIRNSDELLVVKNPRSVATTACFNHY